jgi:uncharacterized protein (UPF0333 family)
MGKKVNLLRKGQAGLEFLTTYAWAFVVILIVIGALAYFGVTNPNKVLPDRCNFGAEVSCINHVIDATNSQVKLRLRNGLGDVIVASSFSLSSESGGVSCSTASPSSIDPWVPGNITDLTFTSCNLASGGFVAGQKEKLNVQFSWYDKKSGSGYTRTVKGEVFSTVR